MEIENRILKDSDYLSSVTYAPNHVDGNAGHKDCEPGVIISLNVYTVRVLFCKSRTIQSVNPDDLVWG